MVGYSLHIHIYKLFKSLTFLFEILKGYMHIDQNILNTNPGAPPPSGF